MNDKNDLSSIDIPARDKDDDDAQAKIWADLVAFVLSWPDPKNDVDKEQKVDEEEDTKPKPQS